jgi:hypothetical protein
VNTLSVARGHIAVVQEQRFRLTTDDGRGLLFSLAHEAPLEAWDLQRLSEEGAEVDVEYEGEPNLDSGVAYAVTPVADMTRQVAPRA